MSETTLPAELESWIEEQGGGRLVGAERRPGGARREAWFVDLDRPDGERAELFLRLDRSSRAGKGNPYSTLRETDVYLALQDTEIPVPRIYGVRDAPQAVLSERAEGETWFSRIRDPDEQLRVASDFVRHLAALHRLNVGELDIPALGPVRSVREHVLQELDAWWALYTVHEPRRDALIEFAFRWLRDHVPAYEGPVVLVQGDTGPGNFLYADGAVQAILDWELSHWGDPMDDIAWLSLRAVQEPFTHFPDRVKQYAELSGHVIDEARIHYYRVFAELRIVIMGHERDSERSSEGEVGNSLIYGALHHRLLVETLADVQGLALGDPVLPDALATSREWLYDAMLDQVRDVLVPRSTDPFVILRAKGLARMLKYLRDADRLARVFEAQESDELAELLGARPADLEAGHATLADRVRQGELDDAALLRHFHHCTARRTELARSASGVLADRHYPPIT